MRLFDEETSNKLSISVKIPSIDDESIGKNV
jgi:hypothetical protein